MNYELFELYKNAFVEIPGSRDVHVQSISIHY